MSSQDPWANFQPINTTQPSSSSAIQPSNMPQNVQAQKDDPWASFKPYEDDSMLKKIGRYAYQPIGGALTAATYPANILQMMGQGESLAEFEDLQDRIPELQKMFPQAPWDKFTGLDREKYMQAVQAASETFPTQQNIERGVENVTGLPLTPQNEAQNLLRLSGSAAAFRPGGIAERTTAGVVAPAVKSGLDVAGVPEPISEAVAYGASGVTPTLKQAEKKLSGLTTRGFESVSKKTTVSPARYEKITEAVEQDFKGISDKLMEDSSLTYRAMKDDPNFKTKITGLFDEVTELSKKVEGKTFSGDLKKNFKDRMNSRERVGVTPDEFERAYLKESRKIYKEIPYMENLSAEQLVAQYRKNNKSLTEIFEPGKSLGKNRAKAEALIDYNRSIAEIIKEKHPDSKFSDLFTFTNKRWSEIKDIESVNNFIDGLFDGKIKYEKGQKFFEKNRVAEPFKRVLGEKNFGEFKGLMDDLMSSQQAYKYISKAEKAGFGDFAKEGLAFLIHPTFAKFKLGKELFTRTTQSLLDKPKLIPQWREALSNIKSNNFKKASAIYDDMKDDLNVK